MNMKFTPSEEIDRSPYDELHIKIDVGKVPVLEFWHLGRKRWTAEFPEGTPSVAGSGTTYIITGLAGKLVNCG